MASATQLTVSDAAEHVGVTRQTIFKAIKSGKLSATQNNRGHMQINVIELLRVYGTLQSPEQISQNKFHKPQQSTMLPASVSLQLELERMKLQLERKDFEIEQMRERVSEIKAREQQANEERLRLFGLLEQQTRLLAAPAPVARAKPKQVIKAPITARKPTPTKTLTKAQPKSKPTTSKGRKKSAP